MRPIGAAPDARMGVPATAGAGAGPFAGARFDCVGGVGVELATGKASVPSQPRDGDGGCFAAIDAGGGAISVDARTTGTGGSRPGAGGRGRGASTALGPEPIDAAAPRTAAPLSAIGSAWPLRTRKSGTSSAECCARAANGVPPGAPTRGVAGSPPWRAFRARRKVASRSALLCVPGSIRPPRATTASCSGEIQPAPFLVGYAFCSNPLVLSIGAPTQLAILPHSSSYRSRFIQCGQQRSNLSG